jgi:NAD(P)-dependent dehydrogenase (short-subunit alcohol dehydrogenase family)
VWYDSFSVDGKTVLLTGAAGGLGMVMLEVFLKAGANVLAVTRNKSTDWIGLDYIHSDKLHPILCDLSDTDSIRNMIIEVRKDFSAIDVLINNACLNNLPSENSYDMDVYGAIRKVGLDAPYILCGEIAPSMKKQGKGSIINITSINAEAAWPNNPAYIVVKSGLRMLTKAVARDFGLYGVRANNVSPGYVHTRMTSKSYTDMDAYRIRSEKTMLGRWGQPEEIANTCLFLASDASSYITGADIRVDGGWIAKGL